MGQAVQKRCNKAPVEENSEQHKQYMTLRCFSVIAFTKQCPFPIPGIPQWRGRRPRFFWVLVFDRVSSERYLACLGCRYILGLSQGIVLPVTPLGGRHTSRYKAKEVLITRPLTADNIGRGTENVLTLQPQFVFVLLYPRYK